MSLTRYLFEIALLAGIVILARRRGWLKLGRRKGRRTRLRRRLRRIGPIAKTLAIGVVAVFVVVPYGLGWAFPNLRHFPSFLEAHKLRLTYGLPDLLRGESRVGEAAMEKIVRRQAARFGLDPALVRAVIEVESGGDPWAVSAAGAMGLMQLMPATYFSLGSGNPFSPARNIAAGTEYLSRLSRRFGGDKRLIAAAYNAGPTLVGRCRCVPANGQTPRYVRKVLRAYARHSGGSVSLSGVRSETVMPGLTIIRKPRMK